MKRLAGLRESTGATSDSEVVRNALLYYEQLVDDVTHGNEVLLRRTDPGHDGRDIAVSIHSAELPGDVATASRLTDVVKRNFVLPPASGARLDALRRQSGAKSDSDVIREAIKLYDKLVANALRGDFMVVRDPKGREQYRRLRIAQSKRPETVLNKIK